MMYLTVRPTQTQQGKYWMKHNITLTIMSLLSVLLMTFHLTGDIVYGMEPGGLANLIVLVVILGVWLYGTLVLAGRPSGYVIILLLSLLGAFIPVVHMRGAGVGGEFAKTSGAFFFVWTLLALGLTGTFSVILSVRGLWSLRKGRTR
jgi:hypothetical protein